MAQQTFEELVAAVKQAESRGKRYASDGKTLTTSPKGALGEMQVMPKTILDPGFGVTPARDKSPDEIARVGVDYLQAMKQRYGDTEKALVAYNWGPGSTDKWIAAGAKPEKLPEETRTYVQRVQGFLGKDVSRETIAKKDREPLPESLPPMAEAAPSAPARTTTVAKATTKLDMANMPASYKAAFALAALADAQDEDDDRAYNENKSTETEAFFASYKPVNHFASLDLGVTPVNFADGGDVTARQDEPFFDAASRTYVDVMTGRRTPITEKDFTAKEQMAMMDAVKKSQARGGKGRVGYEDYPTGDQIGPGYVDIRNTLGGFQYKQNPDGSTIISDRYDFHGPRVAEYEKMGTGEKLVKSAKNALTEFVSKGFSPRDLAGELGRAYVGSKGPEVNIRIPVNRADGSPEEGEITKLATGQAQTAAPAPATRSAKELDAYMKAMNPGAQISYFPERGDVSGHVSSKAQDILNIQKGLSPQKDEETKLHELEHSLTFRAGDPLGRPKVSKVDNNYQAYYMLGDWRPMSQFTQNMVENREKLEQFFGRPLTNAYFKPETLEVVKKQHGDTSALFDEQLASLSALEQITGKSLTRDPEMKKLFPNVKVMSVYDALTGPRQTRMDPRDLPPSTPQPAYTYRDNPVTQFLHKTLLNDNFYPYNKPVKRAEGGDAEPTAEELAAASTPAFIAQKSGIGRKAGPVSQALQSGQGQIEFLKGLTNVPQNIVGAPMDISNMIANVYGGGVEKPFMGSEYIKEGLRAKGLGFTPSTDSTLAGFYGAGDLASNFVNPANVTRSGVKAAEKTGEAARMLAKNFQVYNQQLAVPGASYAIRNRGTPFLNTPEQTNRNGKVTREAMGEADDYADWLARNFGSEPSLKTWLRDKVGAYLRRDFGTESDQMVQAADAGKKLHFMSPKLTENVPHQLGTDIGISRELEGFPKAGFAKTPQGQKVEEVIDSSIYPLQLQDIGMSYKVPKSMQQFVGTNPEMRVSQMGPIDENLKFDELAQAMGKMFKEKEFKAYGETAPMPKDYILTEETLKGLTPAQASNRVANKMEWVEKKRAELAGVAISRDPRIVSQSYDNGSKWISPGDLANNPNHAEMVKDIGCAGGWCTDKATFAMDYGSGENRLNILLDKKFEPRVQLTVNSPPVSVREFILANPHLPEIDAIASNRTITSREVDRMIKAMPEYLDFVKQNQNTKSITEIKGQFNNSNLTKSPYLKQVQDFVKRQGPDLQSVHNLDGIDMLDMRAELPSMKQYGKQSYSDVLLDKLLKINGNSYYAGKDEFPDLIRKAYELPNNAARQIQMNMFQPPTERATGGMIERQPTDNRRYM